MDINVKHLTIVLALLLMPPAHAIFIDSSMPAAAQGARDGENESAPKSDALALFPDLSLYSLWSEFADLLIPRPSESNDPQSSNPLEDEGAERSARSDTPLLSPLRGLFAAESGMHSVSFSASNRSVSAGFGESRASSTTSAAGSAGVLATRNLTGMNMNGSLQRTAYALGPAIAAPLTPGAKSGVDKLFEQPLQTPSQGILKPAKPALQTAKIVWVNTQQNNLSNDACDSYAVLCDSTHQPTIVVTTNSQSEGDGEKGAMNGSETTNAAANDGADNSDSDNQMPPSQSTFTQTNNQADLLQDFIASSTTANQDAENPTVPEPPTILLLMLFGLFFVVARMR